MKLKDLYWIAGLIEGEGSFTLHRDKKLSWIGTPHIIMKMTDKDVMENAARILSCKLYGPYKGGIMKNGKRGKMIYMIQLSMIVSIQWMMTLYPLMGIRRKSRIKKLLTFWKERHVGKGQNQYTIKKMYG